MPDREGIALGLDTFGDVSRGADGVRVSEAQALRDVVAVLSSDDPARVFTRWRSCTATSSSGWRSRRGRSAPTRESFVREIGPDGALYVGAPETVAGKIVATLDTLGATRFDLKYGMGDLPHDSLMGAIELYGTQVAPLVRETVRQRGGTRAAAR